MSGNNLAEYGPSTAAALVTSISIYSVTIKTTYSLATFAALAKPYSLIHIEPEIHRNLLKEIKDRNFALLADELIKTQG
nr:hypothetical protein [Rickettsiaceae bacterium]